MSNVPNSIHSPTYYQPTYPCEKIDKVVTLSNIGDLTRAERGAAAAEIAHVVTALTLELELAKKRSTLTDSKGYRAIDIEWLQRTEYARENLYHLSLMLKEYDRARPPTQIEMEAAIRIRRTRRRFKRQRWQIDTFVGLVEKELGQQRCRELIIEAGEIANTQAETDEELPEDAFRVED